MDFEVKNAPDCLRRSDVTPVYVIFNLVSSILQRCSVWTFINIFEAVFNGPESRNGLDINMGTEFCEQERIVWHDPTIIDVDRPDTSNNNWICSPVIGSRVKRITISGNQCIGLKRFGVPFCAYAVKTVFSQSARFPDELSHNDVYNIVDAFTGEYADHFCPRSFDPLHCQGGKPLQATALNKTGTGELCTLPPPCIYDRHRSARCSSLSSIVVSHRDDWLCSAKGY